MMDYRRRSSRVFPDKLTELLLLQRKLREEKALLEAGANDATRDLFNDLLKEAQTSSVEPNKNKRDSNVVFRGAVLEILTVGDMRTAEINDRVQAMHPEVCDDSVPRYLDGPSNGSKWKSRVRHAQGNLKRSGRITYNSQTKLWALVDNAHADSHLL